MSGTGNPIKTRAQAPPQVSYWQPRARWPQVTRALGTLAVGAAPPLGQPNAQATSPGAASLTAAKSDLPLVNCRTSVAKSKSSCSLLHLLLTCHSAFPQATRPVTFNQLPMPTGGVQFTVQHSPPAPLRNSDTSPRWKLPPATASPHVAQSLLRARHGSCQHVSLLDTRPVKHDLPSLLLDSEGPGIQQPLARSHAVGTRERFQPDIQLFVAQSTEPPNYSLLPPSLFTLQCLHR